MSLRSVINRASILEEIQREIGKFSEQTNLTTLKDALGIPDAKDLYTVLVKLLWKLTQFEKSFAGDDHFRNITTAEDPTSLGSQTINVSLPSGAEIKSAIAIAIIQIMNNDALLQKIDLDLEVDGDNVFSRDNVVGFPAADGASAAFMIVQDVSAIITSTGDHTLEATATMRDAHSTHFTTQYALIITYERGIPP